MIGLSSVRSGQWDHNVLYVLDDFSLLWYWTQHGPKTGGKHGCAGIVFILLFRTCGPRVFPSRSSVTVIFLETPPRPLREYYY